MPKNSPPSRLRPLLFQILYPPLERRWPNIKSTLMRNVVFTVIKKLWTFFGPWGRDRSQSPHCWIFRVKQIHPSTASTLAQHQTDSGPTFT